MNRLIKIIMILLITVALQPMSYYLNAAETGDMIINEIRIVA